MGQLLLRTLDRAQRIHLAMRCRGFDGEIRVLRPMKISGHDIGFFLGWFALFVLMRLYNVPQWMGNLVTELTK
jgi:cobalt/nickel transport system permease protein